MRKFCVLTLLALLRATSASAIPTTDIIFDQDGEKITLKLFTGSIKKNADGLITSAIVGEDFQVKTKKMAYHIPRMSQYREMPSISIYTDNGPLTGNLVAFHLSGSKDAIAEMITPEGNRPIFNGTFSGSQASFYRDNLMPASVDMQNYSYPLGTEMRMMAPITFYPNGTVRTAVLNSNTHGGITPDPKHPEALNPIYVHEQPIFASHLSLNKDGSILNISPKTTAALVIPTGAKIEFNCMGSEYVTLNANEEVIQTNCIHDLSKLIPFVQVPRQHGYKTKIDVRNVNFTGRQAIVSAHLSSQEKPKEKDAFILADGFSIADHCTYLDRAPEFKFLDGTFNSDLDYSGGPFFDQAKDQLVYIDEITPIVTSTWCKYEAVFDL